MKTLEKAEMLERNKVGRVLAESAILNVIDHPFLANLWGTIATKTHLHFLMEFCYGGELYALLTSQPGKRFPEGHVQFYGAEVTPLLRIPLCFLSVLSHEEVLLRGACIQRGQSFVQSMPFSLKTILLRQYVPHIYQVNILLL